MAPPNQPASQTMPSAPGAPASPGDQGKETFGTSSATQATPNAGYEAAAAQTVAVIVTLMQRALSQVGPTTDIGKGILKAMNDLVKLVPAGTVSPASQGNVLDQARMRNTQNMAIQQQLRQRAAASGGNGAPQMPPPQAGAAA